MENPSHINRCLLAILFIASVAFAQSVGYGADYSGMGLFFILIPVILFVGLLYDAPIIVAFFLLNRYHKDAKKFTRIKKIFLKYYTILIAGGVILIMIWLIQGFSLKEWFFWLMLVLSTIVPPSLALWILYRFDEFSSVPKTLLLALLLIIFPRMFVVFWFIGGLMGLLYQVLVLVALAALIFWKNPKAGETLRLLKWIAVASIILVVAIAGLYQYFQK